MNVSALLAMFLLDLLQQPEGIEIALALYRAGRLAKAFGQISKQLAMPENQKGAGRSVYKRLAEQACKVRAD